MNGNEIKPLSLIKAGQTVRLSSIKGGRSLESRLISLGFLPGTQFEVLRNSRADGPVIVSIKGARLVLGRGMSHKIMVS